jgi:hypothetical protein
MDNKRLSGVFTKDYSGGIFLRAWIRSNQGTLYEVGRDYALDLQIPSGTQVTFIVDYESVRGVEVIK